MARSFASASSQYLQKTGLTLTAPLTFAAWFRSSSFATNGVIAATNSATGNYIAEIYCATGPKLASYSENNASGQSVSIVGSTTLSTNTWYQATYVLNPSAHRLWLNGVSEGASASGNTATNMTQTTVGANRYAGSISSYFNGIIAEVGLWNVALTVEEAKAMANGVSPLEIRPASLISYYPLGGHYGQFDLDRWKNRYDLTPSGSPTWADHPRVIYPGPVNAPIKATVASSTKYWTFARQRSRIIGGGLGT